MGAYTKGYYAYTSGAVCTYEAGSTNYKQWWNGWNAAKSELDQANHCHDLDQFD